MIFCYLLCLQSVPTINRSFDNLSPTRIPKPSHIVFLTYPRGYDIIQSTGIVLRMAALDVFDDTGGQTKGYGNLSVNSLQFFQFLVYQVNVVFIV